MEELDEVRTLSTLAVPTVLPSSVARATRAARVGGSSRGRTTKALSQSQQRREKILQLRRYNQLETKERPRSSGRTLPGVLSTNRPATITAQEMSAAHAAGNALVTYAGFNPASLKMDTRSVAESKSGGSMLSYRGGGDTMDGDDPFVIGASTSQQTLTAVDMLGQLKSDLPEREESAKDGDGDGKKGEGGSATAADAKSASRSSSKDRRTEAEYDAGEDSKNDIATLRGYVELMDEFSLHNFVIWKGTVMADTPEFQSFHSRYKQAWTAITRIISLLERLAQEHNVPVAICDGTAVAGLAECELSRVSQELLLDCLTNKEQIRPKLAVRTGMRMPSVEASKSEAATKIQSHLRRYIQEKRFSVHRDEVALAVKLQSLWRMVKVRRLIRQEMAKMRNALDQSFNSLQTRFSEKWAAMEDMAVAQGRTASGFASGARVSPTTGLPPVHSSPVNVGADSVVAALEMVSPATGSQAHQQDGIEGVVSPALSTLVTPVLSEATSPALSPMAAEINGGAAIAALGGAEHQQPGSSASDGSRVGIFSDFYSPTGAVQPQSRQSTQRVIVHIPSITVEEHIRLGIHAFRALQNAQLTRLCELCDRNVTVLYVSPVNLDNEVLDYYERLLELMGAPHALSRLRIIVPEAVNHFPEHFPLAAMLLYSPDTLSRIQRLVRGKMAYIVSSRPGWADKRLCVRLGIPLLGPDPKLADTVTQRSEAKHIFTQARMNVPVGAHDIFEEADLLIALTKLIAANLDIARWLMKMETDFNNESFAYLDVEELVAVRTMRKERSKLLAANNGNPEVWFTPDVQLAARTAILRELKSRLPLVAVICRPDIFPDWSVWVAFMNRIGVVVEAEPRRTIGYPEANLFISPTRAVQVVSTQDALFDPFSYSRLAISAPQSSTLMTALAGASQAVGAQLANRGVIGHVSIQYVSYWDAYEDAPRLWGLGIIVGLTPEASAHVMYHALRKMPDLVIEAEEKEENAAVAPLEGDSKIEDETSTVATVQESVESAQSSQQDRKNAESRAALLESDGAPPLDIEDALAHESRGFLYTGHVVYPGLKCYRFDTFFNLCRRQGISFDVHTRTGAMFLLPDSLAGGVVSLLCSGSSARQAQDLMMGTLKFLLRDCGKAHVADKSTDAVAYILRAVKQLDKSALSTYTLDAQRRREKHRAELEFRERRSTVTGSPQRLPPATLTHQGSRRATLGGDQAPAALQAQNSSKNMPLVRRKSVARA